MQEASARTRRGVNLPFQEGHGLLLSFSVLISLSLLCLPGKKPNVGEKPNATPLELVALLLLALPLLFTLQKFVEDEDNGERSQ
jgi:hypothetical protein